MSEPFTLQPENHEVAVSLARIDDWDLSGQQRRVLRVVVRLSFGKNRPAVWMSYAHLAFLVKMHERDMGRIVNSLEAEGVLQVRGPKRGPRLFRFLPNATLVTPALIWNERELGVVLGEVEALNAGGPNFEPTGRKPGALQGRLDIATGEERLATDQASASRALALEQGTALGGATPAPAEGQNRRTELERQLLALGVSPAEVELTRSLPLTSLETVVANRRLNWKPAPDRVLGETPRTDANSVKHRERELGKTPSCFTRAGARAERSTAPPLKPPALAERSSARAVESRAVAREEERRAAVRTDLDVALVLEAAFSWLDQGDEQDRAQRDRFGSAWREIATLDPYALRLALEAANQRNPNLPPIAWRWSWLRNRFHREHGRRTRADQNQPSQNP